MKLIRFGALGKEKPGVQLQEGTRLDVSRFIQDYDEAFFGTGGIEKLKVWLEKNKDLCPKVPDTVRLGAPMARPSKIICVGLNYAKHAEESGMEPPKEPVLFFKASSAIVAPSKIRDSQMPYPIPLEPPVTMITFSLSSKSIIIRFGYYKFGLHYPQRIYALLQMKKRLYTPP
jgi:2-keto-4-pentenoate hydratase/2-oxohepta-3-ene-1,7-dioic acid hydratase in catechol pathway